MASNEATEAKKPTGLIAVFIVLSLAGQYFFKLGMGGDLAQSFVVAMGQNIQDILHHSSLISIFYLFYNGVVLMLQPVVFLGMLTYALSAVCWFAILSKVDLSLAYPMISVGYIAILLMGWLCFGEEVSWLRWLGVGFISFGIIAMYAEKLFTDWSYYAAALMFVVAFLIVLKANAAEAWNLDQPMPVALLCVALPLGIVGQVLFKIGMGKQINKDRVEAAGKLATSQPLKALSNATLLCLSPFVFVGLFVYVLSTVLWLVLLTKVPLSFLYPLLSVGYILVLLIGWLGFKEKVTFLRWYGVVLICLGIIFIYSEVMICTYSITCAAVIDLLAIVLLVYKFKQKVS